MLNNNNIEIKNKSGYLVVSSQVIARELNKEHKKVCDKIRDILGVVKNGDTPLKDFEAIEIITTNTQNQQQYKEYLLSKNGFILLVMNYTGYNDFKRAYINKFTQMEQQLQQTKHHNNINNKTLHKLTELLKDKECFLTFQDLINISHKSTVADVCNYLTTQVFTQKGNINKLIDTLTNQQQLLKLN